jgi:hypothetical protein
VSLRERFHEMFGAKPNMTTLAKELGVSRQTLYSAFTRDEDGEFHNIDTRTAMGMRRLSGRSLSWIITGEEDSPRAPDVELKAARRVAEELAIELDLAPEEARAIVGRLVLDQTITWADEFDLFRLALKSARAVSVKSHSSSPRPARPNRKSRGLRVGNKVPAPR